MGLINGAIQIGKSAITTSQGALNVTGNNIANAGSPNYARRTPIIVPVRGTPRGDGLQLGGGVGLTRIQREFDAALENRIRAAIGDAASSDLQQQILSRAEAVFNELTDDDLSSRLAELFNAFSDLQNQPQNISLRSVVLQSARSVTDFFDTLYSELHSMQLELDDRLDAVVTEADQLASRIATINDDIVSSEAGATGSAAGLRDQRDALLRDLAKLVDIRAVEQPSGSVTVFIGTEPLVEHNVSRGLTTATETVNGQAVKTPRFASNNGQIALTGGVVTGIVNARDTHIGGAIDDLNTLARAVIHEVNKLHSQGQGLDGFSSITSDNAVLDSAAILNTASAGLDLTPKNGTFLIHLRDADGTITTTQIEVDLDGLPAAAPNDDTLTTLAAKIDAITGITATVDPANRLRISADSTSQSIFFSDDTSNILAALGINAFFKGLDAATIDLSDTVLDNPRMIAAAADANPAVIDGNNAGAIAALFETPVELLNNISISDFHSAMTSDLAVATSTAVAGAQASAVVVETLTAEREAVSGVSTDEEAVNMIRFERAFQGAARYISVINQLVDELLGLL